MPLDGSQDNLRVTLEEIDRLMGVARDRGVTVEPWVTEFAAELRASVPDAVAVAPEKANLALRILSDPALSLGAQAHIAASALRALQG
jgi:hypothetical protein